MKGVSFQNGVEFRVIVSKDHFLQGDSFQVTLHSKPATKSKLALAYGNDKKVKAKKEDAYTPLLQFELEGSETTHSFHLQSHCPISDVSGGLYLLYGPSESGTPAHLKLPTLPHRISQDLNDLLTSHFRFATKSWWNDKDEFTTLTLSPPSSSEFASLIELDVRTKITDEHYQLEFIFERTTIDATSGGSKSKKVKLKFETTLLLKECVHDFNGRLNKDVALAAIEPIFQAYHSRGLLAQN